MTKHRIAAVILLILGILGAYFIYSTEFGQNDKYKFKLGLDLSGGTHLVYKAETENMAESDIDPGMEALRDVIERRINLFGVSEPLVQVEKSGALGGNENRLIVELPGVTDINEAIRIIGNTPVLEFKLVNEEVAKTVPENATTTPANLYTSTGLTGRLLERAELEFMAPTNEPVVTLIFNEEGRALFERITRENVGRYLAIFLDNTPISMPVIREEISQGRAQISGGFKTDEAKQLVRDLNYGALPVEITLVGTQKIGATLGDIALNQGVRAGIWSFIAIAIFLILWYRLPGFLAVVSLAIYVIIMLILFKIIPVTLTSAGLAGFILSIGMAVDANILIFERMKEEFKKGHDIFGGIHEGFSRAWLSIRDSNLSSIITAVVLFWFSSTPLIRGFALILGVGVIVSMFTAITISRTFLLAISPKQHSKSSKFLFNNGFTK